MSYKAKVFRVVISSPSDVMEEREAVLKAIQYWNAVHGYHENILIEPVTWEKNAAPSFGRPQAIINKELDIDNCDALIGIFWTRIGTATGNECSGTVEEINIFEKTDKPIMIYFCNRDIPHKNKNIDQMKLLEEFENNIKQTALICYFNNLNELQTHVFAHLTQNILHKTENKIINDNKHVNDILPDRNVEKHTNIHNLFPTPRKITFKDKRSVKLISSSFLKFNICTISFWLYVGENGEGIRRSGNHYLISHTTNYGDIIKINEKSGYPNRFSLGHIDNAWCLHLSNDKLEEIHLCHEDDLNVGWNLFFIRWDLNISKIQFFINDKDIPFDSFAGIWPKEFAENVFIGTWPNEQQGYYIESDICRLLIANAYKSNDWLMNELQRKPTF